MNRIRVFFPKIIALSFILKKGRRCFPLLQPASCAFVILAFLVKQILKFIYKYRVTLESLSEFLMISFSNSFHVPKQHNRHFFWISEYAALQKAGKYCKVGGIHAIHQESAKFCLRNWDWLDNTRILVIKILNNKLAFLLHQLRWNAESA